MFSLGFQLDFEKVWSVTGNLMQIRFWVLSNRDALPTKKKFNKKKKKNLDCIPSDSDLICEPARKNTQCYIESELRKHS